MDWRMWRWKRRGKDLDEEIAHDLLLDAAERVESGMSPRDAESASRRDFGNVLLIKEATRDAWAGERASIRLAHITHDVRHAVRRFSRTRIFTCTALAVIALGIAANVAVFSIANAVLLRPPLFPDAERVVLFQTIWPNGPVMSASPVMYHHWRAQTSLFQDVAAFRSVLVNETSGATPEQIRVSRVSADYFRLFGATVARGRTFTDAEDRPGGDAVVVLSDRTWTRRFGRADVIGRAMRLDGESFTIVGVLDAAFRVDDLGPTPEAWLPLAVDPASRTEGHFFSVAGRLRPGVTVEHARTQVGQSTEDFRRAFPNALSKNSVFTVQPAREALVGDARPLLLVLLGAVGFVLLIACSNVANLLLLQGASRSREIAIRAAIGAGRGRIVGQLLTESVVLSACGGVLGLGLAWAGTRFLLAMGLSGLPRLNNLAAVSLDWRVVAFTLGVSIATALLCGVVPALRVSGAAFSAARQSADGRASRGPGPRRMEALLVVVQVSLALVLLIGSALFLRAVAALTSVDAGFNPANVLTMRASLGGRDFATAPQVDMAVQRGIEALQAVPGVAVVGASCGLPLEDGGGLPFEIVGRPLPPGRPHHGGAGWWAVSPGYFEALQIPVRRGRSFTARDVRQNPAVVVINEVMARQNWPDEDPIGKRLVIGHGIGPQFQDEPVREIVGVLGDVRSGRLDQEPGPEIYVPQAQLPDVANAFVMAGTPMAWIVRTTTTPEALSRVLQSTLQQSLGLPVLSVRPMDQILSRSITRQRVSMWLMAAFGGTALLLAIIGLYGLIAHSVMQRTREIGIRLALGADPSRVKRMVVTEGVRLVLAGVLLGAVAALALTRLIARWLFTVQASDPATFVVVPAVVAIIAALAVWVPAWRASRIDPMVALRYD
jgi:putative ABC transport system permease protein